MQALVLAAGKGTRMCSDRPKVLHEIFGRPILDYVLETLRQIGICRPKVVIGSGAEAVRAYLKEKAQTSDVVSTALLQKEQKGTGHAVMISKKAFRGWTGDLLIWPGDMPLLMAETIRKLVRMHRESRSDVSVLSGLQINPKGYGRILRAGGSFYAIREELDATEAERRIQEVNTGVYIFNAAYLFKALDRVRPQNKKSEYYLTDTIEVLSKTQCRMHAFPLASPGETQGINSRQHLAEVTGKMNKDQIRKHQERGVTFVAPEQTFIAPGVKIGRDTTIYPWCYIEENVRIGGGCEIGPFAKIRKGTRIGDGSVIGSFVEVNRSKLGKKVMAKHLSYLGDAVIGDETNIGAGTITANFDGKNKHQTQIGKKVLVGADTVFVAPVSVGDFAQTGAGAVLTRGSRLKKGQVVVGVPARPLSKKSK
jgi:bifunctional UDP-N-acetylglucosamine pyrophosphorylase/glucosamine-1-phosphate N-acetyltransferase